MKDALRQGQVVAGRYRIESVIGEGGMGTVYLARHLTLRRQVAIKVLKGDFNQDETYVERFRREAIAASQVVHPNVVYITDFGQLDDGSFYIVMEYLQGVGLDAVIDTGGAQPLSRALNILIQLSDALDHSATVGVVHRDLKPENVMLCEIRGRKDVVKLVDFGIAKLLAPEFRGKRTTLSGQIFGTPEYISPEGAMDLPVDGRSDIYSLGILAFELVTGDAPFVGEPSEVLQSHVRKAPPTPSARMPRQPIPPAFDGIVLRCLAKRPEERYQTAAALCRDLLKMRGQIAGMAANLLGPAADHASPPTRVKTMGAWGIMSSDREQVFTLSEECLDVDGGGAAGDSARHQRPGDSAMALAVSSRDARAKLHGTLKELAFSLGEAAVRSEELSSVLSDLLRLEEENQSLNSKVLLLEQNFERIRFETGERETMLRYAILDLRMKRSKRSTLIQDGPNPVLEGEVKDLSFQIESLEARLFEVLAERADRTTALNDEIQKYRHASTKRDEEIAQLYTELHVIVEGVRRRVEGAAIHRLYERLDDLSEKLQLARDSVRFMRRGR